MKHIISTEDVCGGKKRIKGTRMTIEWIRDMLLHSNNSVSDSIKELKEDYELKDEEINEVIKYYDIQGD